MRRLVACLLGLALAGCGADGPEGAAAVTAGADGWQVHVAGTEAGEDHPGSVLLTRRAEGDAASYRPRLVLGCEEGVTQAYVEWGAPIGTGEVPVAVRVDGAPVQALRWRVSSDGEATGLWHDSTSIPFLRTLLGHARLTVRVTPAGAAPRTGTFGLDGLDSLVAPVQARCAWE